MVQPLTVEPFTKIQANSTWENSIHLGTEYAALSSSGISVLRIPPSRYRSSGARFCRGDDEGHGRIHTAAAQDTGLQRV